MSRRRRSRALLRRAPTVAYSTASPGARASTFACPTASRACCCVFYRLARRAGLASPVTTSRTHALARAEPPPQTADADKKVPGDPPPRRSLKEDERLQVCQKNRFGRTWIFFPPTTSAGQAPTGGSSWRGCLQGLTGQHGLRTKEGFLTFGIGCPRQALSLDRAVPFPHTWFLFPPGPRSARLRSRHDSQGTRHARRARRSRTLPPRQARARVARVLHRLAKRAGLHVRAPCRVALAVACSTASPGAWASTLTRVLPRRALAVACSTALPGARASTFARPTAPRAYCRVFYRLARRAGVDVRVSYRVARLLSRILPPRQARGRRRLRVLPRRARSLSRVLPRQARGRRRSRVLPRRALAVACSTALPGRALAVACSTASPGARASTFVRPTAPRPTVAYILPPRQARVRRRLHVLSRRALTATYSARV